MLHVTKYLLLIYVLGVCNIFFLYFSARMEPGEDVVDQGVVNELKNSLERVEKELQETKERKASLERECIIYQSQLDVSSHSGNLEALICWYFNGKL